TTAPRRVTTRAPRRWTTVGVRATDRPTRPVSGDAPRRPGAGEPSGRLGADAPPDGRGALHRAPADRHGRDAGQRPLLLRLPTPEADLAVLAGHGAALVEDGAAEADGARPRLPLHPALGAFPGDPEEQLGAAL